MTCEFETDEGNCTNRSVIHAAILHNGPGETKCNIPPEKQYLCCEFVELR